MRSADLSTSEAAWVRVGATFRLFMQLRVMLVVATLLLIPRERLTVGALVALCAMAALSFLGGRAWEHYVPRLIRHPALLSLDVLIASGVLAIGGVAGPFFIFTVVTSALAGVLYRWRGMLVVCALQIVMYYVAAYAIVGPSIVETQALISMPVFYVVAGFGGAALRRLLDDFASVDAARIEAEVSWAAASERARLAREMHDSLAKTLRGISLTASSIPMWIQKAPERAAGEARRLVSAVETATQEARSLIANLREEEGHEPMGTAVKEIVREWAEGKDLTVKVAVDGQVQLPLPAHHEAVAILKEALANIEQHSQAKSIDVALGADREDVVLSVRDDGKGLGQEVSSQDGLAQLMRDGHYGLVGMHERAKEVGGTLRLTSAQDDGFLVELRVPKHESTAQVADQRTAVAKESLEVAQ